MLERIVEGWLTSAGERGPFERAFTQMLAIEGHRILHGPVHHPYEHGKDIVAYTPAGDLHAFQLKGEDIGLGELEKLQGQLLALAATAVEYPGVEPPRRPDRVFLVTSGRLSAPARDRLSSFNSANRPLGLPSIEVFEREQLVARFVTAHGKYLPTDVEHLDALLNLLVADGHGPFPARRWAKFVTRLLQSAAESGAAETARASASAMLLSSYVAGPWQRLENHLGAAEAWLTTMTAIMHIAERADLEEERWYLSFDLCRDAARVELRALLEEAVAVEDLVVPDLAEGLVYGTRATVVLGYCSAFFLAERELGDAAGFVEPLRKLLIREYDYLRAAGEAAAPYLLLIANALQVVREYARAARLIVMWASALAAANAKERGEGAAQALADPYHSLEECLLRSLGADTDDALESFDGQAYTLHIMIEWLARRGLRRVAEPIWPGLSRTTICEFRPADVVNLLTHHSELGELVHWVPPVAGSWAAITRDARSVGEKDLPQVVWRYLDTLVYLPLLYPQRLTSAVAKGIDYLVSPELVTVSIDQSAQSSVSTWGPREDAGMGPGNKSSASV